jgi:hypothetical protein
MTIIDYLMLGFFILLFVVSIMKLKPFLSTTELVDDDTTPESIEKLYGYIFSCLDSSSDKDISMDALHEQIRSLETFDGEHFWRLTPNRVRNLVNEYYARHEIESLTQMHQKMQESLK